LELRHRCRTIRRNRAAGGCYFFTVNLLDRRFDLLIAEIGALREAALGVYLDGWALSDNSLAHAGSVRSGTRWAEAHPTF
jgi:hypothetical protein